MEVNGTELLVVQEALLDILTILGVLVKIPICIDN
jgi:hypothetical protein